MKRFFLFYMILLLASHVCAFGTNNVTISNKSSKGNLSVKLNIKINNGKSTHLLSATLYDNSSSRALVAFIQAGDVTINMHDYSNFEKVGELPKTLPRNDTPTDADAGDLILYLGKSFVIYYDKNSWNFTPLGKIDNVSKNELKSILGTGNVTAVLSIKE